MTHAADVVSTWVGGTGNWNVPTNWNPSANYPDNGNGGFTYDAIISSGNVNVNQTITIEKLTLNGGTVSGSFLLTTNASSDWTAGDFNGAGTIKAEGGLQIGSTGTKNIINGYRVENRGTGSWVDNGRIDLYAGSTLANSAGNTLDVQGNVQMFQFSGGTNEFANAGTITRSAGTGTAEFSVIFNNSGTLDLQVGSWQLNTTITQYSGANLTGGTWKVGAGATLNFNNGGTNITTIDSGATVELNGAGSTFAKIDALATVGGSFSILNGRDFSSVGALANSGIVLVGAGGSNLTVNGDYTQNAGATLKIQLDASSGATPNQVICGANAANLAGTLDIDVTGFTPTDGQTFQIVTFGSRSGTFSTVTENAPTGVFSVQYNAGDVTVTYSAGEPEIDVQGNDISIADGDTTPNSADRTDFGNVPVGGDCTHTFRIENTGTGNLAIDNIAFTGDHAADFSVVDPPDSAITSLGFSEFTIRFAPGATGLRTAAVTVTNNDANEGSYEFDIQGTGVTPVSWIGGSGDWNTTSNWSTGALPGANDYVLIDRPGDITVTHSSGTHTVKYLQSQEAFVLSGGSLTVTTTIQVSNTFTISGGTLKTATVLPGASGQGITATSGTLDGITLGANVTIGSGNTLTIANGLTLSGGATITLNGAGSSAILSLNSGTQTIGGTGEIVFAGTSSSNFLSLGNGGATTLTLSSGITVRGKGSISNNSLSTLNNSGTIQSDVSGQTLTITVNTVTNNGTLSALSGATFTINSTAWSSPGTITVNGGTLNMGGTFTPSGFGTFNRTGGTVNITGTVNGGSTLNATTGSWNLSSSGVINGNTVTAAGGAELVPMGGKLDAVTLATSVSIASGQSLAIANGLTLSGGVTITLNGAGSSAILSLNSGTQTIGGTGEIVFAGTSSSNFLSLGNGGATTLTLSSGITVRGKGTISNNSLSTLNNSGTIQSDVSGQTLTITVNTVTNSGTLSVLSGATVTINSATWSSPGTITVNGGTLNMGGAFTPSSFGTFNRTDGTVNITGTVNGGLTLNATTGSWNLSSSGIINGNTVTAADGAQLVPMGGKLDAVTLATSVSIASGQSLAIANGLTLSGGVTITLNGAGSSAILSLNSGAQTIGGTGEIVFAGTSSSNFLSLGNGGATTLTLASGITVRGKGTISNNSLSTLNNLGTIESDVSGQTLTITVNSFTNNSTLSALSGATFTINSATWSSPGTITLNGGTLNLGGVFTPSSFGTFNRTGGTVNITGTLDGGLTLNATTGSWNLSSSGIINGNTVTAAGGAELVPMGGKLDGVTLATSVSIASGQSVAIANGLTLSGGVTITLNGAGSSAILSLNSGTQTIGGNGEIVFAGTSSSNFLSLGNGGATTLTLSSGITVRGKGTISNNSLSTLNNSGTVQSDVSGQTLTITVSTVTNNGTLSTLSGATFTINSATWSSPGTITVNDGTLNLGGAFTPSAFGTFNRTGGTVNITGTLNGGLTLNTTTGSWNLSSSGIINGNTVTAADGAELVPMGGKLDAVTLATSVSIASGQSLAIANGLTLSGGVTITLNGAAGSAILSIAAGTQTIGGNGEIVCAGTSASNFLSLGNGGATTLTLDSGITARGKGTISNSSSSTLVNQGTIRSDVTGQPLTISVNSFSNQGVVEANGGTVNLAGTVTQYSAPNLTGGTWKVFANSTLTFPAGANVTTVASGATVILDGASSTFAKISAIATNNGGFSILGGRDFTTSGAFANAGSITVGAGSDLVVSGNYTQTGGSTDLTGADSSLSASGASPQVDIQDGTLIGIGTVTGNVRNDASVAPGSSPGTIDITGDYEQTANGVLDVEIAGINSGEFDRLEISGSATLNGTLNIEMLGGFTPTNGQPFQIMTFGSRSGTFSSITDNDPNGLFTVGYNANDITITYAISLAEIDVQGNSVSIADGDTTPDPADHTDFGNAAVSGGSVVRTFTILNSGTVDLTLSGTPLVEVSGINAADFAVTTTPTSPVASLGSTTFSITFDPSAGGVRSATVTIANDDGSESPYEFSIQGRGVTKIWDGGAGDFLWQSANNWSGDTVPTSTDDVLIDTGAAGGPALITVTVSSGAQQAKRLLSEENFTISAGSVALGSSASDQSTINGTFTLSGGTLQGVGSLTVDGAFNWSGGAMTGAGQTMIADGASLNVTGAVSLSRLITNQSGGTITMSGSGQVSTTTGVAVLDNQFGAVFDIQNGGGFGGDGGGAETITNAGLFKKTGTGASTLSNVDFSNSGTLDVQAAAGNFTMSGTGTFINSGVVTVGANRTLTVGLSGAGTGGGTYSIGALGAVDLTAGTQTFTAGADISGGLFKVNGGAMTASANMHADDMQLSGGAINGASNLTIDNSLAWSGGAMSGTGQTVIANGASLNLTGSVSLSRLITNQSGGTITMSGSGQVSTTTGVAVLDNQFGAVFDIQNGGGFAGDGGGAETITNAGLFKKTGTGASTLRNVDFSNSGTLEVQTGAGNLSLLDTGTFSNSGAVTVGANRTLTLGLSGAGTGDGTYSIDAGGVVDLTAGTQIFTAVADISGGLFKVNGGTMTVSANMHADDMQLSAGTINGASNLTIDNSLAWSGGAMTGAGQTVIADGASLNVTGAVSLSRLITNQSGGTITMSGSGQVSTTTGVAVLDNQFGAVFDIQNGGGFGGDGGGAETITNAGLFKKAGAGASTLNHVNFSNSGTLEVQAAAGNLSLSGTGAFSNSGAVTVGAGRALTLGLNGSGTGGATYTIAAGGVVELTAGTQTFTAGADISGGLFKVNGGTMTVSANMHADDMQLSGGTINGASNLTIDYSLAWSGGAMSGAGQTVIASSASLSLTGAVSLSRLITNQSGGTITMTGSGQVSTSAAVAVLDNQFGAVFDIQNGGGFAGDGGGAETITNAGLFKKTGTGASTLSNVDFSNSGTLDVQNGTLRYTGTISQYSGTNLTGGHWKINAGATLNFDNGGSNIATIGSGATVELSGAGSTFAKIDSLTTVAGNFSILNGRDFSTVGVLTNSGIVLVGTGGSNLTANGNYTQDTGATLKVQLDAGSGGMPNQVICGANIANLAGTLDIDINGFTPTNGETFQIMTFGFASGTFSSVTEDAPNGSLTVDYNANEVTVVYEPAAAGAALDFDGANDYVTAPTLDATSGSFSLEAWLQYDGSAEEFVTVMEFGNDSPWFGIEDGKLSLFADATTIAIDSQNFPVGVWTHAAITYDAGSNTVRLYKNGVMVASATGNGFTNDGEQFGIGNQPDGTGPDDLFDGRMDEVRVWNVARTCAEVNHFMDCELSGVPSGLLAYYKFNQGIAGADNSGITTLTDATSNHPGNLTNFALTGAPSNFMAPGGVTSGNSCAAYAAPEIAVKGGASPIVIVDGDTTPAIADGTDFGYLAMDGAPASLTHVFTIENMGNAALALTGIPIVSLDDATHFSVTDQPAAASIGASGALTFEITFDPVATGLHTAIVHIANDDCDENPYTFAIHGHSVDHRVTNINDSGDGSLRQAILDANLTPGLDTITFDVDGAGPHTIQPTAANPLPTITDAVIVDGYSQPDAQENTVAIGSDAVYQIVINGSLAGTGAHGLVLAAGSGGSTVKGLVIQQFLGDGMRVESDGNTIIGNRIGTDPAGSADMGNGGDGIMFAGGSDNNLVGGASPQARNLISGNDVSGIAIGRNPGPANNNQALNNYIGTNAAGAAAIGNFYEGVVLLNGSTGNLVGGNLVSGNGSAGVTIHGCDANTIKANRVGTNAIGQLAVNMGNGYEGNTGGIVISGDSYNNVIGGNTVVDANIVAASKRAGVVVASNVTGNNIKVNSIHDNTEIGIDLGNDGPTPNDVGDGDSGANELQNFPTIGAAQISGGRLSVTYSLDTTVGNPFTIRFYEADSVASGEGKRFLAATAVTAPVANSTFDAGSIASIGAFTGMWLVGHAADSFGNASEFSAAFQVTGTPGTFYVNDDAAGTNDGSSWTNAFIYLQDALAVAQSGDTIWIAQGTYYPDEGTGVTVDNRAATFQQKNGVGIFGGFPGLAGQEGNFTVRRPEQYVTLLSGDIGTPGALFDNSYHVVTASNCDATAKLDGVSIADGNADDGVGVDGDLGGGMFIRGGVGPSLANLVFSGNFASEKGAALYHDQADTKIVNALFYQNHCANHGGAVANDGGADLALYNATFVSNSASQDGGAVWTQTGLTLANCAFIGNSALQGGAVAVVNSSAAALMASCSFYGNSAGTAGGGIFAANNTVNPTVTNSVLAFDFATAGAEFSGTVNISYSLVKDAALGGTNIDIDPLFIDPAATLDGHLRVQPTSPVLGAGNTTLLPDDLFDFDGDTVFGEAVPQDRDGNPRVALGGLDMGAYERPSFTVGNTNDVGPGSLRFALTNANRYRSPDAIAITFVATARALSSILIQPLSPLPVINARVAIDGYSHGDATLNTLTASWATNAVIVVELDGSLAGANADGLTLGEGSDQSTVAGLAIHSFSGHGVVLESAMNSITGCFIGTNPSGAAGFGNGQSGILGLNAVGANEIGGDAAADRNLISGNGGHGVWISGSGSTLVRGNIVGADPTGMTAMANAGNGVYLDAGSSGNTIGGDAYTYPLTRNLISGNEGHGVALAGAHGNYIYGNLIGVKGNGAAALPNGTVGSPKNGVVLLTSDDNYIGWYSFSYTTQYGNVVSGNSGNGITIQGGDDNRIYANHIGVNLLGTGTVANSGHGINLTNATKTIIGDAYYSGSIVSGNLQDGIHVGGGDATIKGNIVGANADKTAAIANGGDGIEVAVGSVSVIGGDSATEENIIAYNVGNGVAVIGATTQAEILRNSIFDNGGLGIDLGGDGRTANDGGDVDASPNHFQNFPTILAGDANIDQDDHLFVMFTVDSEDVSLPAAVGSLYPIIVRFFEADDPTDLLAQGKQYIDNGIAVIIHGPGTYIRSFGYVAGISTGDGIVATATDDDGNTSEFSDRVVVTNSDALFTVTTVADDLDANLDDELCDIGNGDCTLRAAIEQANARPGRDTIEFNITAAAPHGILPGAALPIVIDPVIINGYSDDDASPNTLSVGNDANITIVLDGDNLSAAPVVHGLRLNTFDSVIKGLQIVNFPGSGIYVDGDGNIIEGNFIGTDGAIAIGNADDGVTLVGGAEGNYVGPLLSSYSRNVISGNGLAGIAIGRNGSEPNSAASNYAFENYIGVKADGNSPLGNSVDGVFLTAFAHHNHIYSNNVISGNSGNGIAIIGDAYQNVIYSNAIGIGADLLTPVGNGLNGILMASAYDNTIGIGNTIAHNTGDGITVASGTGNRVTGNSIFANGGASGLGIDLGNNGPSANDTGDTDAGANNLYNFPTNIIARIDANLNLAVRYTLDSDVQTNQIEFFEADASNAPQGQRFVGADTLSLASVGIATKTAIFPNAAALQIVATDKIVATAADYYAGDSSEFSAAATVAAFAPIVVTTAADENNGLAPDVSLREAILAANDSPGADVIHFAISGAAGAVHTIVLGSVLPDIADELRIEGYTQNGGVPNSATTATNAAIKIVIDGNDQAISGLVIDDTISNCVIRGLAIVRCGLFAIELHGSSHQVLGNFIGADVAGTTALGNGQAGSGGGVQVTGWGNQIGDDSDLAARNLISGNHGHGILITDASSSNAVWGNLIGVQKDGSAPLGNEASGIFIAMNSIYTVVGNVSTDVVGDHPEAGNVIAFNGADGIAITGDASHRNLIRGNAIFQNGDDANQDLGVDLNDDGVTPNDTNDQDGSPNQLQNFPVIDAAIIDVRDNLIVTVTVNSSFAHSASPITVDLYEADASIRAEGRRYIATDVFFDDFATPPSYTHTISFGDASYLGITASDVLTALAWDGWGNTSEFAAGKVVTQRQNIVVSSAGESGANTLDAAIALANSQIGVDRIVFAINPLGDVQTIPAPVSGFPPIMDTVEIDGYTQSGSAVADSVAIAILKVILDGSSASAGAHGLTLAPGSAGSIIRGLVIHGFDGNGVMILSNGNTIAGNFIGTDGAGAVAMGNSGSGIRIDGGASGNAIGGTNSAAGNRIAFNGSAGVAVASGTSDGGFREEIDPSVNNAILGNSIFGNAGLGIDLGMDGVTANDLFDGDVGANTLQNAPELTIAIDGAPDVVHVGLHSTTNTTFRIELFTNPTCDASGFGEGAEFLQTLTLGTEGDGNGFTVVPLAAALPIGTVITATATSTSTGGPPYNSSEFSNCAVVLPAITFAAATHNDLGAGALPYSVALGDFDLDGDTDVAAAAFGTDNVQILFGDDTGALTTSPAVSLPVNADPVAIAAGDFNHDGAPDLATANSALDSISILLNDGSGSFTANAPLPVGDNPRGIAIADLNQDGNLDAAVANKDSNSVSVYMGDGGGGFAFDDNYATGAAPVAVLATDLNADGKIDLITANFLGNQISVLLRTNDNLAFVQPGDFFSVGANPVDLAVGDFNGDGMKDVVVANAASDDVTILYGNGTGGFAGSRTLVAGDEPTAIAAADLNADMILDLVVTNRGANTVSVWIGNGNGEFVAAAAPTTGTHPEDVAIGFMDAGAIPDLVTANSTANSISVILGSTDVGPDMDNDGLPNAAEATIGTNPADADTDNDGLTDGVETHTHVLVDFFDTGTDPLAKDTDADSALDGVEVALGFNPSHPAITPEIVIFGAAHVASGMSTLYEINQLTGVATAIGVIGYNAISGMDFDDDGVLFAIGRRPGDGASVLITIDITTGAGVEIGVTGIAPGVTVTDLSFRPGDGVLFAHMDDEFNTTNSLVTIDTVTGVASAAIGSTGSGGVHGDAIAFSRMDILFHAADNTLETLDTSTAGATTYGSFLFSAPGADAPRLNAMDFLPGADLFFAVHDDSDGGDLEMYLSIVNPSIGVVSDIGLTTDGMDAIAVAACDYTLDWDKDFVVNNRDVILLYRYIFARVFGNQTVPTGMVLPPDETDETIESRIRVLYTTSIRDGEMIGDVDKDGRINQRDLVMIYRRMFGHTPTNGEFILTGITETEVNERIDALIVR